MASNITNSRFCTSTLFFCRFRTEKVGDPELSLCPVDVGTFCFYFTAARIHYRSAYDTFYRFAARKNLGSPSFARRPLQWHIIEQVNYSSVRHFVTLNRATPLSTHWTPSRSAVPFSISIGSISQEILPKCTVPTP